MTDRLRHHMRGRKPMADGARRSHTVSVRLSRDELERLDAQRGTRPRGEWIRGAALGAAPAKIPELNAELYGALHRVARSLEQLAGAVTRCLRVGFFAKLAVDKGEHLRAIR